MNAYEAKIEAKRMRLMARADKLNKIAERGRKTFDTIHSYIPFGQPILVGHHSEKRHRRDLDKANRAMHMAFEADKLAGELRARASGLGEHGISSDDPEAPDKLKERIAELEKKQATMTAANKVIRAFWKHGQRGGSSDEQLASYFLRMAEAGIASPAIARELLTPDYCNRLGFADYQLSNNSANIRRLQQRARVLEARAKKETKTHDVGNSGIQIVENVEANRLQMIFPGKPDADTRALLKSRGFRWSPSEGAWQRHLGTTALWNAQDIAKRLFAEP